MHITKKHVLKPKAKQRKKKIVYLHLTQWSINVTTPKSQKYNFIITQINKNN